MLPTLLNCSYIKYSFFSSIPGQYRKVYVIVFIIGKEIKKKTFHFHYPTLTIALLDYHLHIKIGETGLGT